MRIATILSAILLAMTCLPAGAQDAATRKVEGRGVEGRPAYRGGGVVKFLDVQLGAQVVHYKPGDGLPWPLEVTYDVLEPAPVLLTSRLGTEHWRLYDFDAETMSALYTDKKINLTQRGRHTAKATKAHFGKSYGPLPDSGLVGIRGHYYFLIDQPNGQWLDVTDPPAFFDQPEPAQRLIVTLADLTRYELSIPKIQSTWKPGGPFRVRLVVTDASANDVSGGERSLGRQLGRLAGNADNRFDSAARYLGVHQRHRHRRRYRRVGESLPVRRTEHDRPGYLCTQHISGDQQADAGR
jgi:hypothetical protein